MTHVWTVLDALMAFDALLARRLTLVHFGTFHNPAPGRSGVLAYREAESPGSKIATNWTRKTLFERMKHFLTLQRAYKILFDTLDGI